MVVKLSPDCNTFANRNDRPFEEAVQFSLARWQRCEGDISFSTDAFSYIVPAYRQKPTTAPALVGESNRPIHASDQHANYDTSERVPRECRLLGWERYPNQR